MKKIFHLIIAFGMIAIIASCDKNPPPAPPTPPPPPPPPSAPTLTLSVVPDVAWYSSTSVVSWFTTNTDSVLVNGIKVSGNSLTTPTLMSPITYTITAVGPGGSVTKQITANIWSQRTTLLCNYGRWKVLSYQRCRVIAPNTLSECVDFDVATNFCYTIRFAPNDTVYNTRGPCRPDQGITGKSTWYWQDNEQKLLAGITLFNVGSLDVGMLYLWRDEPDAIQPSMFWRYSIKYVH